MGYKILPILSFIFCSNIYSANFYVANEGNDSNAGTENSPWKSIQFAVDNGQVNAGDTITVKPGSYQPFHVTKSGNGSAQLVIKSASKYAAIIQGSERFDGRDAGIHLVTEYVTIDGFDVVCSGTPASNPGERGIRLSGFPNDFKYGVIIRNNRVTGAGWVGITTSYAHDVIVEFNEVSNSVVQHGIYIANSGDRPIIRNNIIHNNNQAGLHMNGDLPSGASGEVDGTISNAIIENNIIYANSGGAASSAINLDGVNNSIIRNNLLYNNFSQGISNFQIDGGLPSSNNRIINNTLVMPNDAFHALKFRNGSDSGFVRNNILIQQGSGDALAVCDSCMQNLDSDYNIIVHLTNQNSTVENHGSLTDWQNNTGQDANSLTISAGNVGSTLSSNFTNPTNTASADYSLVVNSIAIDTGATVSDASTDINGYNRPSGSSFDIGAYEFGGASVMPTPQNVQVDKN